MEWSWSFVAEILPTLLQGVRITVLATLLGFAIAAVVGLVAALLRRSANRCVSIPTIWVLDFLRCTPLLVQLYFLFYILPNLGILLSPLAAGVIGIGLHYATYAAEVYRAGIDNVPRGQSHDSADLVVHHPPPGHFADDSGAGELPDRDVQGNTTPVGGHGAGVDEPGEKCSEFQLSLPGTNDIGRCLLPGH
jgi:His/Glu/Gln/Arg/opine family amino acid ABC transporter permease subunit